MRNLCRSIFLCVIATPLCATHAFGAVSRAHQLSVSHGLQIQGVTTRDDVFHLDTFLSANYTAVLWGWDSNTNLHGPAPGVPWARWIRNESEMPPRPGYNEEPYMSRLVSIQLGDEYNLNDPTQRQATIDWLNSAKALFPSVMTVVNNYGSQLSNAALDDLLNRGRPDVISFDTYPYVQGAQPWGGSPLNWYADMERYRQFAAAYNVPLGQYRQTFHDNYWRDPSPSEFRLNTFAALAFNVKYLADFTYNTGNSAFFIKPGGDSNPTPLYQDLITVNRHARNLGKALVALKPIDDAPGAAHTTSIMIIRGKHKDAAGNVVFNDFPGYSGLAIDPDAAGNYTDWVFGRNDPYLSGPFNDPGTVNQGFLNDGLRGDVILSWFKLIDESLDGDAFNDERYLMVTNGLADMNGDEEQTRQRIKLNFGSSSVKFPYTYLEKLDRETGQVVPVPLNRLTTNVWQLDMILDGGTSELFKFPTGAPFVIVPEPASVSLFSLAMLCPLRRRRR